MPHSQQCIETEKPEGFCVGAGCYFTKADYPGLYEAFAAPVAPTPFVLPQREAPYRAPDANRPPMTLEMLKGLRYDVVGDTLAITSDDCTCDGGIYGHQPYCGVDPVVIGLSNNPDRVKEVADECNYLLDQLRRALEPTPEPEEEVAEWHWVDSIMGGMLHALVQPFSGRVGVTDDPANVTCQQCISILRKQATRDGL